MTSRPYRLKESIARNPFKESGIYALIRRLSKEPRISKKNAKKEKPYKKLGERARVYLKSRVEFMGKAEVPLRTRQNDASKGNVNGLRPRRKQKFRFIAGKSGNIKIPT